MCRHRPHHGAGPRRGPAAGQGGYAVNSSAARQDNSQQAKESGFITMERFFPRDARDPLFRAFSSVDCGVTAAGMFVLSFVITTHTRLTTCTGM